MKPKILVIEDNADTRRFLEVMLRKEFDVRIASNGLEGLQCAKTEQPELIVLDIVMPALNGYDACKELKSDPSTQHIPVIFLSGRNTTSEITQGISMGADDYLPKPFDHKELLARIKSRIARSQASPLPLVKVGLLEVDPHRRLAIYDGQEMNLTLTEYDIIRLLSSRFGVVVTREEIMKEIWRDSATEVLARTIDVHIRSLRKKNPAMNKHIESIYGMGYKYVP